VLEDSFRVNDDAFGNPRRDEDGRHANSQTIEVEGEIQFSVGWPGRVSIGYAGGRRNMIEDAAVLVVNDKERGAGPERWVRADGIVDLGNIKFACLDVMVGVLIGGELRAVVVIVIGIVRLDEAIVRELSRLTIRQKLIIGPE